MRVQEIGLALKQAESRLAELGVVIPDKLEALRKAVGEVAEKDTDNEAERFREHIEMIVADLKRAGDSFLDTSERFVRFVEGRAPYRSKLGDELVATEQFQIILAANREAPEVFRELIKLKESEVSSETISVVELKLQMKVSLEKLQLIFTKTEQDATELWGTVTREYRKMSQEYRSGTQAQDEEEYLMSVGSLLRVVCEESERMENTIRTALLENS